MKHLSRDHKESNKLINPMAKQVSFNFSTPQAAKLQTKEAEFGETAKLIKNKSKNILNYNIKTEQFGKATKPVESSASLKRNIQIESDSDFKPYLCTYPGCGKRYKIKSNFSRHAKLHPNDA